ncbi:unnamed protein product [Vitrella brassicaformis CCMP3155]|uniref:N-acetyltransferase domain-containing protein n=3 Tax=Vitrella brassicaformis TaxID=1169539 RepID=A0A0G4GBF0_VITBC|nr:unnamed protein product [Vitrella brassicaformis CCMP3155]|eukprot:CEM26474.1 unnamed protein product [Vitrella brassicaformis CCMP3155]
MLTSILVPHLPPPPPAFLARAPIPSPSLATSPHTIHHACTRRRLRSPFVRQRHPSRLDAVSGPVLLPPNFWLLELIGLLVPFIVAVLPALEYEIRTGLFPVQKDFGVDFSRQEVKEVTLSELSDIIEISKKEDKDRVGSSFLRLLYISSYFWFFWIRTIFPFGNDHKLLCVVAPAVDPPPNQSTADDTSTKEKTTDNSYWFGRASSERPVARKAAGEAAAEDEQQQPVSAAVATDQLTSDRALSLALPFPAPLPSHLASLLRQGGVMSSLSPSSRRRLKLDQDGRRVDTSRRKKDKEGPADREAAIKERHRVLGFAELLMHPFSGRMPDWVPVPMVLKQARFVMSSALAVLLPFVSQPEPLHPYICNLLVRPECRRKGVGSRLVKGCEKMAAAFGSNSTTTTSTTTSSGDGDCALSRVGVRNDVIGLHAEEDNESAIQLYLKLRYRIVEKVEWKESKLKVVYMMKDL